MQFSFLSQFYKKLLTICFFLMQKYYFCGLEKQESENLNEIR